MEEMDIDRNTTSTSNQEEEKAESSNKIVVLLVGAPGSGKSTFCESVIRVSTRPWTRICQDTIGNGKAGTKTQCLKSATNELKEGRSVFIDRCNLDRKQRAEFLKLGGSQVEKHAVVFDLPAKLCISRSVKRNGHEGNLQGGKAAIVVNRMLQKKVLPKLNEGYARIMLCHDEKDVQAALDMYSALGPLDTLPSGCFGEKNQDVKTQQGIMKFLKKVDPAANSLAKPGAPQDTSRDKVSTEDVTVCKPQETGPSHPYHTHSDVKNSQFLESDSADRISSSENVTTLAFPSISTADFQFNLEKASDIIVEKVDEYVHKLGNARLVLVDISQSSKILALVREKAAQRNIDSTRFFTFVGDITRLYSKGDLHCNVIANAANWRLKPGGGGVNAAIYSAAGPELEKATKERAESLRPGKAVIVPLPSTSPLFMREGVTHVIHVLGPNMNPQRPNCLNKDYDKGCNVLREAYSSLFEGFAYLLGTKGAISHINGDQSLEPQDHCNKTPLNIDLKVKREALHQPDSNKKYKGFHEEPGPAVGSSASRGENPSSEETKKVSKKWGSWAQALHNIALHPDRHKNDVIEVSEDVVVINDIYPKARRHLLVLARTEGLDALEDVRKEHLPLLETMHAVGLKYAEKFSAEDESLVFRLGYHSVPSMRQLHLHVISQDFDSKHLKNKKHWNSFNSAFFRDSVDVLQEVNENGKPTIKGDDSLLSMELRCHRCRSAHPNIPRLKSHIASCQAPFPANLLQDGRLVFASGKG